LVPDDEKLGYGELRKMVGDINESEVPKEDVLSDSVYKYDRVKDQIVMLEEHEE